MEPEDAPSEDYVDEDVYSNMSYKRHTYIHIYR